MKTIRFAFILLALALLMAFGLMQIASAQSSTGNYVLAQWEWDISSEGWVAPDCTRSLVDLRSIPEMSTKVLPLGYGLFVLDESCAIPSGGLLLATGPDETISPTVLREVESRLGIDRNTFNRITTINLVWELLTVHSDPTGLTGPKPIIPGRNLNMRVNLGETVLTEQFNVDDHPQVIESLRIGYDRIRDISISRDNNTHLKLAGYWRNKYGFDVRSESQQLDGVLDPETSVAEDWNCVNDATSIDCRDTWTLVQGTWELNGRTVQNTSNCVGNFCGLAGIDTALSGADMSAETIVEIVTSTLRYAGPAIRLDNVADTAYLVGYRDNSTDSLKLGKVVAGTYTQLGVLGGLVVPADAEWLAVDADGTTITGYHITADGTDLVRTSFASATDSSIDGSTVGGLHTGIYHNMDGNNRARFNFFSATDDSTVATATPTPGPGTDQGDFRREVVYDTFGVNTTTPLIDRIPNVRPNELSGWRVLTANSDDWNARFTDEKAVEVGLVDSDHKVVIDSELSDGIVRADLKRAANQRIGLVVRSDGSGDLNNVYIWHNGSTLNIAKRIGGAFTFVTNTLFNWNAGVTWSMEVRLNGCVIDVYVDNLQRLSNVSVCDDELVDNTFHGFFSRDGDEPGTFDNFGVYTNDPASDDDTVDFTPFFYIAGFLIGLTLVGYGERYNVGQYIMAGAVILVAAAIPTGLAWLMILMALVFIPLIYRGYRHIVIANSQGEVE